MSLVNDKKGLIVGNGYRSTKKKTFMQALAMKKVLVVIAIAVEISQTGKDE